MFQIITAVLWKMQVFLYVTLQFVMFWCIKVQHPTLLKLDGEGATILWNAHTITCESITSTRLETQLSSSPFASIYVINSI
jgi:hypothetical protein